MSAMLPRLLDNIHVLTTTSRLAVDIAYEMNIEEGAVINPILCSILDQPTMVLMASDMACNPSQISRILNIKGNVKMLNLEDISSITGSGIDKLFPLEISKGMPTIIDASLKRFDTLYSRAGSAKCLIATTFSDLKMITGGIISYALASPAWHPRAVNDA